MNKKFNKNDPGPGQYEVPSMFDRHATPLWFLSKVFNSRKNKNKKNQSFLNFVYTALAEYTLFLSIQFMSGSMISHQVKRHKYIKTGTKILSFSIKLD